VSKVARILLLAVMAIMPCNAEPLGRLFLTPEQRKPSVKTPEVAAKATPVIGGILRNSRGGGTIWIDGRPQPLTSEDVRLPPERAHSAQELSASSQVALP